MKNRPPLSPETTPLELYRLALKYAWVPDDRLAIRHDAAVDTMRFLHAKLARGEGVSISYLKTVAKRKMVDTFRCIYGRVGSAKTKAYDKTWTASELAKTRSARSRVRGMTAEDQAFGAHYSRPWKALEAQEILEHLIHETLKTFSHEVREIREQSIRMALEGYSHPEIAAVVGRSDSWVCNGWKAFQRVASRHYGRPMPGRRESPRRPKRVS